ncbi:MAG: hypothetical protein ACM3MG_12755, partial [Bacillota bacterium]
MGKPRRHLCLLKVITCIAYFVPMLALSHTEPINKNEHNNSSTSEEHFLDQIGFKSFIPEIKNSLGSSKASIASKIALKENLEKYRILDESKSLALFIYSQILSGLSSHDVQIRASRLTAHLLRPPIESQFLPIPSYFKETMTHEEYQKETEKYLDGSIRAIKDNELKALTKYTVETIALANHLDRSSETYVQLKKQLYTKFQSYLVLQNKYYELASSRYLGRAMTALLIRYNRNNPSADLEAQLNFLLSRQDDYLSNYITASYTVRDRNHIQKTVPLRSGDFVNKYSFDAESFLISAGVEPGDKANRDRADELNLVNSLLDLRDFPTPAKGRAIAEKIAQNISLTPHEEELYLQTRLSSTGKGF